MHRKKDGGADDESGGVQVGGWRQRPVVEVQRGKSGGDSSGSPLTWRRTCPERARGACGAADGRTPGGRRGRIGADVGASANAWAGRIDEAGQGSFASAKLSAGGRTGRQSSVGKIALCGCGRDVEACAAFRGGSFGQASSDFFAALGLRRERLSGSAFAGAEARQRRSEAAEKAVSGSGIQQKRSFFLLEKSSPVNDNEILFL